MKGRQHLHYLIMVLAGASAPLGFAPFNYPLITFLSLLIFLGFIQKASPKQAFIKGWWWGLGFFGVGVSWVRVSMEQYGGAPWWLALALTFLFVAFLALFTAVTAGVFRRWFSSWSQKTQFLLAWPALWMLNEWIRSTILTGFPWVLLGQSQVDGFLAGWIPIVGDLGVSFLYAALVGGVLLLYKASKQTQIGIILGSFLVLITGWGLQGYPWTHTVGEPKSVSLVQGNVPQDLKWSPGYQWEAVKRYISLSYDEWGRNILIWPETAVPMFLDEAQVVLEPLAIRASVAHTSLVTGIVSRTPGAYYNSVIALGEGKGHYNKQHLVPFGEFVPFASVLRGLITFFDLPMSDFASDTQKQNILKIKDLSLAPSVCYEIAFTDTVRQLARKSDALLTVSNDTWFGKSIGPHQHFSIARIRAMEMGQFLLRATNNGISAIIAPTGRVITRLPQFQAGVLRGEIYKVVGKTPYLYWGQALALALAVSALLIGVYLNNNDKE